VLLKRSLHNRYVINFEDFPLRREGAAATAGKVAADWPELLAIIEERVKGTRATHSTAHWWHFERYRAELQKALEALESAIVLSRVGQALAWTRISARAICAETVVVITLPTHATLAASQSRVHEVWVRFMASTWKTASGIHQRAASKPFRFRVTSARALANHPAMILADEPTASLDTDRGLSVMRLLRKVSTEQGTAVLVVTHDERMIGEVNRVLQLNLWMAAWSAMCRRGPKHSGYALDIWIRCTDLLLSGTHRTRPGRGLRVGTPETVGVEFGRLFRPPLRCLLVIGQHWKKCCRGRYKNVLMFLNHTPQAPLYRVAFAFQHLLNLIKDNHHFPLPASREPVRRAVTCKTLISYIGSDLVRLTALILRLAGYRKADSG
jgi:hypothetical protein